MGGGVRKDAGLGGARVQEGDEYAPLKMSRTVHEQVKQFKVSLAHSLAQSVTHSLLLPSSTHPLTRSICHPLPPSSLQHTLTHSLNLSPIPSFFPPAHTHSLAQSVTHSLILPSSTRPLTRSICHPFPPSSLQHTPTHSLNLSPIPSFFPPGASSSCAHPMQPRPPATSLGEDVRHHRIQHHSRLWDVSPQDDQVSLVNTISQSGEDIAGLITMLHACL